MVIKQWTEFHYDNNDKDHSRALQCQRDPFSLVFYNLEATCEWLREGVPRWEDAAPEWYTEVWIEGLPPELADALIVESPDSVRSPEESERAEPSAAPTNESETMETSTAPTYELGDLEA
jgi:hypothetical protein